MPFGVYVCVYCQSKSASFPLSKRPQVLAEDIGWRWATSTYGGLLKVDFPPGSLLCLTCVNLCKRLDNAMTSEDKKAAALKAHLQGFSIQTQSSLSIAPWTRVRCVKQYGGYLKVALCLQAGSTYYERLSMLNSLFKLSTEQLKSSIALPVLERVIGVNCQVVCIDYVHTKDGSSSMHSIYLKKVVGVSKVPPSLLLSLLACAANRESVRCVGVFLVHL